MAKTSYKINKSRRNFLKKSVAGGIAAVSLPALTFGEKASSTFFHNFNIHSVISSKQNPNSNGYCTNRSPQSLWYNL